MFPKIASALPMLTILAACSSGPTVPTSVSLTTPDAAGTINAGLAQAYSGKSIDTTGSGYAFQIGATPTGGMVGLAGIVPGTAVTPRPTSGTGIYVGVYQIGVAQNIVKTGSTVTAQTSTDTGAIGLAANFATGAVTSYLGPVTVNGVATGTNLTGTVTYNGVPGILSGQLGGDKAVGALAGSGTNFIYAGGFIAPKL